MTHCTQPLPIQGTPEWASYRLEWVAQVEKDLARQRRLATTVAAPTTPLATLTVPAKAPVIGIIGNGAYSSSDSTSLNLLAQIFIDNNIPPLCYSYRGPGQSYAPQDTISSSIRTYAEYFLSYMNHYDTASFHFWCYSLSGLALLQFLHDIRGYPSILQRIRSVALLASPALLDGGMFLTSDLTGAATDPLWKVISGYSVDFGLLPTIIRNSLCSMHCPGDKDVIALCRDTCLDRYSITDHASSEPNCSHLRLPRSAQCLNVLRQSLI